MISFHTCRTALIAFLGTILLPVPSSFAQTSEQKHEKPSWVDRFFGIKRDLTGGWLFAGYRNDGKDGIYFVISKDGYHWKLINDGRPMLRQSQQGELMRDPFVQRAPDGSFRMVWTWSMSTPAVIGYSTSSNLVFWSEARQLSVIASIPTARNAWAPAMYFESDKKEWLILWSSTVPAEGKVSVALDNRIYATTTADFKHFTPARIFFDPGYDVTNATLVSANDKTTQYHLLFNDEHPARLENRIIVAKGFAIDGPWRDSDTLFTKAGAVGAAIIHIADGYLLYYDHYDAPQHYGAEFSTDLQHWSDATSRITFPAGLHHGSFLHIEANEYNLLRDYHQFFDSGLTK